MSASNKPITKGFRYFFGIHMGIGRHIDVLKEIRVGGKTAWKGAKAGQARWKIDAPMLFGGDDGEGGIHGTIDMMTGAPDQPVNRRLADMLGGLVPAFRGACTLFYDGLITSMSPYPKPWEVRAARTAGGWDGPTWYPEKVTIALGSIQAMNPAHVLYEAITNRDWGRGKDRSMIDDAQWRSAADALHAEGFGLCLAWKQQDKISSFMQSVLDHIGAAFVLNRRTGKLQLLLIRDNYVAADLPLFDEDSGLLSVADDENAASAPAANEIIVTFSNPEAYGAQQQVRVQNAAAIASVGGPITETVEFLHIPTASLALRVAQRILREKSVSKRLKVTLDRRASGLQPGTPFRIRSTRRGIAEMVLRAGKVEDGTLASGAITVTAMQDAFGLPNTSFVEVQPPEWLPPATAPLPATVRKPFELSYRDLVVGLSAAELAAVHPTAGAFGIMVRRPTNASINYVLLTTASGAEYIAAASGDFCPSAQIVDAIAASPEPTQIKLTFVTDIAGFTPGAVGVLDEETVQLVSVDWMTGRAFIRRGCVDTVPAPHAAGARLWLYTDSAAVDPTEYTAGMTVLAKVLPYSSGGWLDAELAPIDALVMAQRQARPFPPAGVLINGERAPATVIGPLSVTWFHRDRILQADQVVDATMGSIGPEPGTTYLVRAYDSDDLPVHQSAPIEGAVYETEFLHDGPLRLTVTSVRDGLECWQTPAVAFRYIGTQSPELPEEAFLATEEMRAMATESGLLFALDTLDAGEAGPVKISELPEAAPGLDGSEILAVVQDGVTVRITAETLREYVAAGIPAGRSAYENAVAEGFIGDVAEWLESLRGPAGGPTHIRFVSGPSYILAAANDAGAWLECTAGEIQLPETDAAGFAVGMFVEVRQRGLDPVRFVAHTPAVTLDYDQSLFAAETRYPGAVVVLKVTAPDTYVLVGALADA